MNLILKSVIFFFKDNGPIHAIFQEKSKRSQLLSIVMSFLMISLIASFIIISFAATSIIQLLHLIFTNSTGFRIGIVESFLIRFVIPVFLVFITAAILYTLLPVKKTTLRNALCGGVFTALLLEADRHLFNLYVVNVATQMGAIYGPLSSFVIFLLWIYYAACIFLIGAELVRTLDVSSRGMW